MKFSDEMINAYADGELGGSEKADFERALQQDPQLQQALDEKMLIKARVKAAYAGIEMPQDRHAKGLNYSALMYACLLVVAFLGGWTSSDLLVSPSLDTASLANNDTNTGVNIGTETPGKFILHIGDHDLVKFNALLDRAESIITRYQDDMQLIELEVVANAAGLDLLRESGSPYAQRVKQISKDYPNIRFIACSNAIERFREKEGVEPDFIPVVQKGPTALDQVVKRMNQGWTYIKI